MQVTLYHKLCSYINVNIHLARIILDLILHSGKIWDWKNHFTVAQSEEFDQVYAERMKGYDIEFDYE